MNFINQIQNIKSYFYVKSVRRKHGISNKVKDIEIPWQPGNRLSLNKLLVRTQERVNNLENYVLDQIDSHWYEEKKERYESSLIDQLKQWKEKLNQVIEQAKKESNGK